MRRPSRKVAVILALSAVYVLWGANFAGMRVAVQTLPPWFIAGARHGTSGVLMLAFTLLVLRQVPARKHFKTGIISGVLLLALGNGLVVWALQYLPSSVAAFLVSATPIWLAILDFTVYGARPTIAGIAGLLLGLAGVFVLVYDAHARHAALWPAIVCVIASVAWALGTLYQRQSRGSDNLFAVTSLQMLSGGAVLLFASLFSGEPAKIHAADFTAPALIAFASLIFGGSLTGYVCYLWLVRNVPTPVVATYAYVNPLVAALLGVTLLHEVLAPRTIVAGAIILSGVVLMLLAPGKRLRPGGKPLPPPNEGAL